MNLLLIGNYFSGPGHNHNVWQDLAVHLPKIGFGVITTSSKAKKIPRLLDMLKTIWLCRNNYQIAQIDVFSGQAFIFAECSARLLQALNKPFVLTLHGGNLPKLALQNPQRVKKLLNIAKRVIAPSHYLREQMSKYRPDVILIPNPLELSKYPFILRKSPEPKLIWLRSFHEIYNPSLAPRVLAKLLSEFPEAHLTMIGPDKGDGSRQNTERVIEELRLPHHVEIRGGISKSDVPEALSQGDIFINTTHIDNTPISVMEAMACGLCVVSTNVGGIPYLLDDGVNALLVPPNDPQSMACAISRIMTEPGLAENISTCARQKTEGFDWSFILPKWESLFQEIVNE